MQFSSVGKTKYFFADINKIGVRLHRILVIILVATQLPIPTAFSQDNSVERKSVHLVISGTKPLMLKPNAKSNVIILAKMWGLSDYSNIKVVIEGDVEAELYDAGREGNNPINHGLYKTEMVLSTENIPIDACLKFLAKATINTEVVVESSPYELCVSSFDFMSPYGKIGPKLVDPASGVMYVADELMFIARPKTKESTILRIADSIHSEVASWNPYLNSYTLKLDKVANQFSELVQLQNRLLEHSEVVNANLVSISSLN